MEHLFGELLDVKNGYPVPAYISDNYSLTLLNNKIYLYDELSQINIELSENEANKYTILKNDLIIPFKLSNYKNNLQLVKNNNSEPQNETESTEDMNEFDYLFEDSDFLNDRYITMIVRQERYDVVYIFFLIDKYTNILYHITETKKTENNYM